MTSPPPPQILLDFAIQARQSYPLECCGVWLFDNTQQQPRWQPLPNRSSSPHHSFVFDTLEWLRLLDLEKNGELTICGLGHSHPDSPPLLSNQDLAHMLWEGKPTYPNLCWMIASVFENRNSVEFALYEWDKAAQCFFCGMRQSLTPDCAN